MRLVIDNTNSARLPSHAQTGSGVILSAPLPTIPCPELPAGTDGYPGKPKAAARATGQGLKAPFMDAQAACAVTHHTWTPWTVFSEWHDLSKYEVPLS